MMMKRIGERVQPWKIPSAKWKDLVGNKPWDVDYDRQVIIVAVHQAGKVLGKNRNTAKQTESVNVVHCQTLCDGL